MTQTPTAPPTPAATAGPVLVVGAGLLGASIGLGLRHLGVDVWLQDSSPTAEAVAQDIGAGRAVELEEDVVAAGAGEGADMTTPGTVVVAAPPPDLPGGVQAQ